MTSATSSNNLKYKNSFLSVFIWTIKKHKALAIIYSSLLIFSCPVISLLTNMSVGTMNSPVIPATFAIVTTTVAMVMSIIVPVMLLDYMHNKRKADIFGAMPITRRKLFFSRYLAGLAILIVPYLINGLISILLSLPCVINSFYSPTFITNIVIIMLFAITASYSFTSFIAVCSGTTANAVLCTIFINLAYPMAFNLLSFFSSSIIPGVNIQFWGSKFFSNFLAPLISPYENIVEMFFNTINHSYMPNLFSSAANIALIICSLVMCFFFTKKRKTEAAQNSFAYKAPGVIISLIVTAACGMFVALICSVLATSPYNENGSAAVTSPWLVFAIFIIAFIITAFFAHIVVTVIYNKGFTGFLKSLICYVLVAVFISGIYTTLAFGCFGMDKYVPSDDEIKSANLTFFDNESGYSYGFGSLGFEIFSAFLGNSFDIEFYGHPISALSKEDIGSITDIHREIIDSISKSKTPPYHIYTIADSSMSVSYSDDMTRDVGRIVINYELKNGSKVERNYNYSDVKNCSYLMSKLLTLKEHSTKNNLAQLQNLLSEKKIEITSAVLNGVSKINIDKQKIKDEFISAFLSDFNSVKKYEYTADAIDININYCDKDSEAKHSISAFIPKGFNNTIKMLEQYGYAASLGQDISSLSNKHYEYFELPENISNVNLKDNTVNLTSNQNSYMNYKYINFTSITYYLDNNIIYADDEYIYDDSTDLEEDEDDADYEDDDFIYTDETSKPLVDAYRKDKLYCRVVYSDKSGNLYYYDEKFSDFEKYANIEDKLKALNDDSIKYNIYNSDISYMKIPLLRDKNDANKIYTPSILQLYTDDEKVITQPLNIDMFNGDENYGGANESQIYIDTTYLLKKNGKTYIDMYGP